MWQANKIEVVCAQLCGNSHFTMKSQLYTYDDAGYGKWLENAKPKEVDMSDF